MERQNLYLMTLASLLLLSAAGLATIGGYTVDVYLSMFTVCYFVTSTIFRPRRLTFDFVGVMLFTVFAYIVALRVLAILAL